MCSGKQSVVPPLTEKSLLGWLLRERPVKMFGHHLLRQHHVIYSDISSCPLSVFSVSQVYARLLSVSQLGCDDVLRGSRVKHEVFLLHSADGASSPVKANMLSSPSAACFTSSHCLTVSLSRCCLHLYVCSSYRSCSIVCGLCSRRWLH